ncbi:MAG: WG repeat-containing protein [Saprospiraceae bacterium]
MLHKGLVLARDFLSGSLLLTIVVAGCKSDASTKNGDYSAYMADYEPPSGKWGFVNAKGKICIDPKYDDVGPFSEGLAAVNLKGLWGYIDQSGEIMIKPSFKSAWTFRERKSRIQPFEHPQVFIQRNGNIIESGDWSADGDFSEGRARVKVGKSFGYIDSTGHLIIQPIYSRGWNFKNGICIVEFHEKFGVIDPNGIYILKPAFDYIGPAGNDSILLCLKQKTAFAIDRQGHELASFSDSRMMDSDGSIISVKNNEGIYLYDLLQKKAGNALAFSDVIYLNNAMWLGKTKDGFVLIDRNGSPKSTMYYQQVNKYSEGLAAYCKDGFWGYLDTSGKEKINNVFGIAWNYKDHFARASFSDGIAFIDSSQVLAFYPPTGTIEMRDFSEGLAAIQIQ